MNLVLVLVYDLLTKVSPAQFLHFLSREQKIQINAPLILFLNSIILDDSKINGPLGPRSHTHGVKNR